MRGDPHAGFCESRGVRFPPATHLDAGSGIGKNPHLTANSIFHIADRIGAIGMDFRSHLTGENAYSHTRMGATIMLYDYIIKLINPQAVPFRINPS